MKLFFTLLVFSNSITYSQSFSQDSITICGNPNFTEYPGGNSALNQFIFENFEYQYDSTITVMGCMTIWVEFVIYEDGSVNEVNIIKGVSELNNKKVLNVFSILPNWTPSETKTTFNLPIRIRLE